MSDDRLREFYRIEYSSICVYWLGHNLTVVAALARAFELGTELEDFIGPRWCPGCQREAP